MEKVSEELIFCILNYLDIKSTLVVGELNKKYCELVHSTVLWNLRNHRKLGKFGLKTGAYYSYNPNEFSSSLFTEEQYEASYENYKALCYSISHPRSLVKSSIESSYNQALNGMLKYEDDLFWNSKMRQDTEQSDFVTIELTGFSIIFSVHFKVYRATTQGGHLFPPKLIRVHIGNSSGSYHYSSDVFKVPMTEKYCTLLILPQIVTGCFVKIEFIGSITSMPGSTMHITAIEFLDIVGSNIDDVPLNNFEQAILDKNLQVVVDIIERSKHKSTPFAVSLMEKMGILQEVLGKIKRSYNEVESYAYLREHIHEPTDFEKLRLSEALGDLCFENGAFNSAFHIYLKNMDIWKLTKTAIVLKHTAAIKSILTRLEPRFPRYSDLINIAKTLGPDFERYITQEIGQV